MKKGFAITCIRIDHGREFENIDSEEYCNEHGIDHNFLAPRTPQQNRIVEKKNRTFQEMARIGMATRWVRGGAPPSQPCPVFLKQFPFPSHLKN